MINSQLQSKTSIDMVMGICENIPTVKHTERKQMIVEYIEFEVEEIELKAIESVDD